MRERSDCCGERFLRYFVLGSLKHPAPRQLWQVGKVPVTLRSRKYRAQEQRRPFLESTWWTLVFVQVFWTRKRYLGVHASVSVAHDWTEAVTNRYCCSFLLFFLLSVRLHVWERSVAQWRGYRNVRQGWKTRRRNCARSLNLHIHGGGGGGGGERERERERERDPLIIVRILTFLHPLKYRYDSDMRAKH